MRALRVTHGRAAARTLTTLAFALGACLLGACKAELAGDPAGFFVDSQPSGDDAAGSGVDAAVDATLVGDAPPDARVCAGGDAHVATATTCLLRFDALANQATAATTCAAAGATLAIITTAADQAAAITLGSTTDLWIGLDDKVTEGTYVWPDGTPAIYRAYAAGEPNNGGPTGNEDCSVLAFTAMRAGLWDDRPCNAATSTYAAVCSYPL
ncbi:MAG: hypothetical protein H7287_08790 [Thermoleophilia bacterium]|nr:hypothetical protein [Thermoleophilia bacterium]